MPSLEQLADFYLTDHEIDAMVKTLMEECPNLKRKAARKTAIEHLLGMKQQEYIKKEIAEGRYMSISKNNPIRFPD